MTAPTAQSVIEKIARASDRRLAWEFFVLFSRFEYALKRAGFLKNLPDAQADWGRFAREVDTTFWKLTAPAVAAAVTYYEEHPPRKQQNESGELRWSMPMQLGDGEKRLELLCRAICQVRNNLFHGGKFPQLPVSDPSRDQYLLENAKEILFALVELNVSVRRHFVEGIGE